MKLPRDLSAQRLLRALRRIGYRVTRQTGSHIRLTCDEPGQQHHITIPDHSTLKIGTLAAILAAVAEHRKISREQLLDKLFG